MPGATSPKLIGGPAVGDGGSLSSMLFMAEKTGEEKVVSLMPILT